MTAAERAFQPTDASHIGHWDDEADVIVVGFGAAGAAAAIEAARAGADVLVLERAGGPGGASAMSGGMLYLGGGTPIQQATGFEDTPEAMAAFLMAACGPFADRAKVDLYAEGSVEHFHWAVSCDVPFMPTFDPEPHTRIPQSDVGLVWVGENSYPFDELARPAPRGHRPAAPGHGGWLLMERLIRTAEQAGVRTAKETALQRLVLDDGEVVGVVARRFDEQVAIRARRGVVLAAGGFVFNDAMLDQFAPALIGHGKIGTDNDDGSAINAARAVGAAVKRMDAANASLLVSPFLLCPSVLVNGRGQRFINEDTYQGRVGQHSLFLQRGDTFLVVDGDTYDNLSAENRMGLRPNWVCDTVAELESESGLPEGALQETVEYYNRHAADGVDPVFHKAAEWLRPLAPPFGAIDLRPTARADGSLRSRYWVFTLGGLHTTIDGEVLDLAGDVIPGLYGAGRTTSGIQAWGYISGTSLGEGTFFGRRAGRAAEARQRSKAFGRSAGF